MLKLTSHNSINHNNYNGKTKRGRNGRGENLYGTVGEVYKLYEIG